MFVLESISTLLVIVGVVLITIPKIQGLYVMAIAQVGWTVFSFQEGHWFFFAQSLFLLVFNFIGIRNWKRKKVGCTEKVTGRRC